MSPKFNELVAKLREIFEIDRPELDFGIYRILHSRSEKIDDFLLNRLSVKVREALVSGSTAQKKQLQDELDSAVEQAKALGADPNTLPKVQDLKAKLQAFASEDDAETQVYAHLLTFFSRYYEDGDFISKRRYKEGVYAIPYSGEEVKLHWANADQYYIKSGEAFSNYDFTLDGDRKVHFKLIAAETAKDNVKDNEAVRCFVLWDPKSAEGISNEEDTPEYPADILEVKDGELYIYFQYRKFMKGTKQKTLLDEAFKVITEKLTVDHLHETFSLLSKAPTEKDKNRTVLEKHLAAYTAKNTSDYFIHKDLKGFLSRELDFYIKNEMMHLDDVQSAEAFKNIELNLRQIQAVRVIALELIDFMAQLENFQKKLWLKKKFVTSCNYCITMDRVPEALRPEILANKAQQAEWKKLATQLPSDGDLFASNAIDARMVDTRFFDETFKAKLLREIPDLDEQCDGLLIHSDNYQALNIVQSRFSQSIDVVYIDPPYNADATCIIYKNGYRHSSWNSLMQDRLMLGKNLMQDTAVCCTTIDDYELYNLKQLLDICFGDSNFLANVTIRNNPSGRSTVAGFAICHEYALFYAKNSDKVVVSRLEHTQEQKNRYDHADTDGRFFEWENLRKSSAGSYRSDRPKQFFPIYYSPSQPSIRVPFCEWNAKINSYTIDDNPCGDEQVCYPIDSQGRERVWGFGIDRVRNEIETNDIVAEKRDGRIEFYKKKYLQEKGVLPRTWWEKAEYSARDNGSRMIANLFGSNRWFDFPKAVEAVKDSLRVGSIGSTGTCLDYFGGSGTTAHATIALNREDGGHRKYILVEMGDHFDTVLKPRIEKVVFSPDWKDGKPTAAGKGVSHCFKYLTLESYEDALNNIELTAPQEGLALTGLQDEYLLKYMLDIEAKGSIISTDDFKHPFDYKLKIAIDSSGTSAPRVVDLPETFKYLIGLKVAGENRRISDGFLYMDGILPNGDRAFVLWRDVAKLPNDQLNEQLARIGVKPGDSEYDVIYVNGDHAVPNATLATDGKTKTMKVRQIENEFLEKMFEGID